MKIVKALDPRPAFPEWVILYCDKCENDLPTWEEMLLLYEEAAKDFPDISDGKILVERLPEVNVIGITFNVSEWDVPLAYRATQ